MDLAARFSAWQVRDGSEVLAEGDSRELSAFGLGKKIRRVADEYTVDIVLVEDLAPMMTHQIDRPLRLQGIVAMCCHPFVAGDTLRMVQPQAWQKFFPGVGRAPNDVPKAQKDAWREERARQYAAELGYTPPDLVAEHVAAKRLAEGEKARILVKDTKPLAKNMTDYVDAFLIGEWAHRVGFETLVHRPPVGVNPFLI